MLNHRFSPGLAAAAAILVFLGACTTTAERKSAGTIHWRSLAEGRVEASDSRRPLVVDFFFGQGCHRCAMLENEVYSDPEIADKVNRFFVPVRVDLTKQLTAEEQALADDFKSGGECMLLFLDPDGRALQDVGGVSLCFMGMVKKNQFMAYLDDVLSVVRGVRTDPSTM